MKILEALLFAADKPLSLDQLMIYLEGESDISRKALRLALENLQSSYEDRAVELIEVASGFRFQTKTRYSEWVSRLWDEKPQRYSRALLETLALVAYRQPITRGDIEEIRGVSVSSHIMKTLLEREWVRVIGHREVPGRPAIYGTTKQFLDYFNLKSLDQLPALADIRDLETIGREMNQQLEFGDSQQEQEELDVSKEPAGSELSTASLDASVRENVAEEVESETRH